MPKINTYDSTVTVNNLGNVAPAPQVSIGNPIGSAVGQLGQATSQVGDQTGADQIAAIKGQYQQQQQDAAIWSGKTLSDARLQWMNELQNRQNSAVGAGTGLATNYISDFDKYAQDTVANAPDENSKKFVQQGLTSMRDALGGQALSIQNQMHTGYNVNQMQDTIQNNAKIVAIDPSQAPTQFATTKAVIDAMDIPQEQKFSLVDNLRSTMVFSGLQSKLMNDPQALLNEIKPAIGQLPEGTPQAMIADKAKQAGVDPALMLAIGGAESGINPNAKNSKSSASGIFQFTKSTGAQYGVSSSSPVDQQIDAGIQFTKDNINQLRGNLGRQPSSGEIYAAHVFGASGASNLIQAPQDMPIADAIKQYDPANANAIVKNNKLTGLTVGQTLNKINGNLQDKMGQFVDQSQAAAPSFVRNIATPQELFHFEQQAQQAVDTQAQQQAVNLTQTVQDHEAMAMTGKMPQQLLTADNFSTMYPNDPQKAQTAYGQYSSNMKFGQDVSMLNGMNAQQEASLLSTYKPSSEQGYAGDLQRYQELAKAVQAKHSAIDKDPAQWAMQNSTAVQSAYNNMNSAVDPAAKQVATQQYYSSVLAEQQKQGVVTPKLLTNQEVQQTTDIFKQGNSNSIVQQVNGLRQKYGSNFGTVNAQLAADPAYPPTVIPITNIDDSNVQQRIAASMNLSHDQMTAGYIKSDQDAVNAAVGKSLTPFLSSMPVSMDNSKTRDGYTQAMQGLTYSYMRQGISQSNAVQLATKDVLSKYTFTNNNATSAITIRIPNSELPNQVMGGANTAVANFDTTGTNIPPTYKNAFQNKAIWTTLPDETGLSLKVLDVDNIPKQVTRDGQPVTYKFSDLRTMPQTFSLYQRVKNAITN